MSIATDTTRKQKSYWMRFNDRVMSSIFLLCAIVLTLVIVGVFYFVGSKSFLIFFENGGTSFFTFFSSMTWDPIKAFHDTREFGALGLILGSLITTLLAVLIAAPLAVGMALFMTEVTPRPLARFLQPLLEIFTGMPSVVIGFLGFVLVVPVLGQWTHTLGYGYAAAIIVLVFMILPTITSISIDALRAVPMSVREASFALGSTKTQMMLRAVVPAAASGLATAIVLGMTRAIGETLAVAMVLGGYQQSFPDNIWNWQSFFEPITNITRQILMDFSETRGVEQHAYWTLAFFLLVISFLFVCLSRYLASRSVYK